MAALMSSLASIFNSTSTLFTLDIYKKLYPESTERYLLKVGRIATAIVVLLGIAWIPIMQNISGVLYEYLQSIQAYIAPPITAVFLLGIFWKRINSNGAVATLFAGLIVAAIRIILELNAESLDGALKSFAAINFAHFAIYMFFFCVLVCIAVSLATPQRDISKIQGLSFDTLTREQRAANKQSYTWVDIVLSIVLVAIVISVLVYFRG